MGLWKRMMKRLKGATNRRLSKISSRKKKTTLPAKLTFSQWEASLSKLPYLESNSTTIFAQFSFPQLSAQPNLLPTPATKLTPSAKVLATYEQPDFWAFVESFIKEQNSSHTKRAYENDLLDFLNFLKSTAQPMNIHTLVNYRSALEVRTSQRTKTPLSRVSINRKIATIKSFLNWLVLNGVIPNNPAKAMKSFRAGRESPTRDISDDMVRRMLEIPSRHSVAGRLHYAIMMVLFHLGLRRAELVDLKTSDLFEQGGIPCIRVRGKGDKERILPLPASVFDAIEDYLVISQKKREIDQPLFSPAKNNVTKIFDKPLHPNAIAYVIQHYASLAGVPYKVSPHSARATAVSNALDHQASHRSVQHMAGWSSPLMVTRYDKRKSDLKNSAVRFVNYDNIDLRDERIDNSNSDAGEKTIEEASLF